jgi:hypothetical protein
MVMAHVTRRRFMASLLTAAGAAGIGGLGYGFGWEPDHLTVTRLTLSLSGWPQDEPPLLVGQLTDLHCCTEHSLERAQRAARLLMANRPEVVLLTGDFLTHEGTAWAERVADVLAITAAAPLGAFAVLGNHDHSSYSAEVLTRELGRVGIPVLRNQPARVAKRKKVWIVGVESIATRIADARVASIGVPDDAAKIMLIHEPDFADYAYVKVAIQLSGHSHGGQVRIPGLPAYSPPGAKKYRWGYYPQAPSPVFISRGVGTVGLPIRIACPPEVALLRLRSHNSATGTPPIAVS